MLQHGGINMRWPVFAILSVSLLGCGGGTGGSPQGADSRYYALEDSRYQFTLTGGLPIRASGIADGSGYIVDAIVFDRFISLDFGAVYMEGALAAGEFGDSSIAGVYERRKHTTTGDITPIYEKVEDATLAPDEYGTWHFTWRGKDYSYTADKLFPLGQQTLSAPQDWGFRIQYFFGDPQAATVFYHDGTLQLNMDGSFVGSDTIGCSYSGQVQPGSNGQYPVVLHVSGCNSEMMRPGDYEGYFVYDQLCTTISECLEFFGIGDQYAVRIRWSHSTI